MSDNPLSYNPDDNLGRRPQPRFQRKKERSGGLWQIILALVSVAVFAGVVWYIFAVSGDGSNAPAQIILSEGAPFKRKPDQPTGMIVPDQDKLVYDEVSGTPSPDADGLMAPPEEPVARPEPEAPQSAPQPTGTVSGSNVRNLPPGADDAAAPEERPAPAPTPEPIAQPEPAPAPEQTPAPAQTAAASPDWGSVYRLQIGSFRSVDAAKEAWSDQRKKYPSIFSSPDAEVQKADLGDRGIYFRLRAGKYSSRSAASSACTQLKNLGGDCLIVAPDS